MGWVPGTRGRWDGGRIWEDTSGRLTYVIRRMIGGKQYEVSTRCSRLRPALSQLERFEADPDAYDPAAPGKEPLRLTAALVKQFLAWSGGTDADGGKGNTRAWVLQQKAYLAWWAEQLGGRDLRRLDLATDIIPRLDGVPGRKHRVEVLKAFFSWMRKRRHLLSRQEDATIDLEVPARRPEQWRRPKAIPRANYLRALAAIPQPHRDSLALLDETGWHVSELARFARGGSVEPLPKGKRTDEAVAVLVCPRHKSGAPQRTAVGREALEVAERVLARGGFSVGRFYEALKATCEEKKIPPFTPGRFRHTMATRAVEAGADPAQVSAYLGHKSEATMRRFYATLATVPRPAR